MKSTVGCFGGLAIAVFTFIIIVATPVANVADDIACLPFNCGSLNPCCGLREWGLTHVVFALIIAPIVGVAGFLLTSWYLGKKGAEEDSS